MAAAMAHEAAAPGEARRVDTTEGGVSRTWISRLTLLVALLAVAATTAGIVTAGGAHHRTFVTLRGDVVTLQGGGLYANESVSAAAQAIGQDIVTLLVGVPLLLVALGLASRGSPRGRVLQAGALWYFAYTYLLMAFGAAYNPLFLVYVALFSASLFAFVLYVLSIEGATLRAQVSPRFARRTVAGLIIGFGVLLALLWLGRIVPTMATGAAPAGMDSSGTAFVQAGDLGLVVPLAILAGALLLKRRPVGYVLAGVLLVKGTTFGLALGGMMVAMAVAGTGAAPVEVVFFAAVTILCGAGMAHFLVCLPARSSAALTGATG